MTIFPSLLSASRARSENSFWRRATGHGDADDLRDVGQATCARVDVVSSQPSPNLLAVHVEVFCDLGDCQPTGRDGAHHGPPCLVRYAGYSHARRLRGVTARHNALLGVNW
jgi:hypothetical protein